MIDAQRYSPNWWDYSFCVEVDFRTAPFERCGYYFERPFNAENFLYALDAMARGYDLDAVETLIVYVKYNGSMRVRPGPLWMLRPATSYVGDVYDLPIVWDPFTKFPFGPLEEKR
jgi:hypothetical protein